MSPDGLERLSREELLELLRRKQEEFAEREAAIERRDAKIWELEEELAQFRQPAKTPAHSSVPPSQGQKVDRCARRGRKRGPKRRHLRVSRVRGEPELVVMWRPSVCDGCGETLPETGGRRVGPSHVIELPPVQSVIVEAHQYAVTCPSCGTRTVVAYSVGLEPRRTFGPGIEALLGGFHERHHVSYERLEEICRDVFSTFQSARAGSTRPCGGWPNGRA